MAGTDPAVGHRRSSYFYGCMSPSCVPVQEECYTRIHDQLPPIPIGSTHDTRRRRWQKIIKKLVRESKSIYGSTKPPPPTFRYDAVSYSQNFDEGCHREELTSRCNPQYKSACGENVYLECRTLISTFSIARDEVVLPGNSLNL
ncbi:hypothetical protein RHGRI_023250 [Rhododendron griersonianum]|uniref:Uncharacterized protein n=1 Tax=Rhododendron griersonianum TaxID=479676 RepID=A0AAV6J678_9ERIC|nr:hypothetical protein RHGRI_023250 [Rhododendron griersonianum]